MSYCLNPSCDQPLNSDGTEFCQSCGTKLMPLLRNRYRIIQPLGGGGFGRTFLAEDEDKLKEHCVVKQLVPQVTGTSALHKATELFREEARRLQQLGEHPQIPTLYAYFREDNYLYLVQQLIKGQTLRQELKEQGMFSEDQIWEILSELLAVLKFIHEHQVVHRDLKPENIIRRSSLDIDSLNLSTQGANLVLIDFGVAKQLTETSMEHTGTSIGSYGYASMEQMKHGFAYPASDLFSLGATCFYLLTAIPPYHLYMEEGYNWVSHWREHLPSPISVDLQQVLDKLLQKDMNYRYQSADEVLQDVQRQAKRTAVTRRMGVTPLPSKISLKSSVSPKTVIQPQILLPKKILLGGAGAILLLLGTGGYLLHQQNIPLTGHLNEVNAVAFSPVVGKSTSFEAIFASGSDDKTVKLWNLTKKREIRTFKGHSDWVYAVAISPDGQTVVSGSKDKIIKVWNLNTGEEIRTLTGHLGEVLSVAISPDGQTVVSGSTDDTIKIWNVSTGQEIRTLSNHSSDVNALAISPNGHLLVSASDDKTIKLWNLKTGKQIRTLTGHTADVNAIAFSPNGENVATGSDDKTVKVWNLSTGLAIYTFDKHTAEVFAVAYSPDGKTLVSASKDKTIRIWQLPQ